MSGLLRNLLTLIQALLARGRYDPHSCIPSHYWITPLDCGISVLKSDRYLLLAEAAQLDFLVRTRLIGGLLRGGVGFVNVAQLVRFMRPVRMFSRLRVETAIVYADDKFAYFSHRMFLQDRQHGEVLVKMKFKKAAVTVRPGEIIGGSFASKPSSIEAWDQALAAL